MGGSTYLCPDHWRLTDHAQSLHADAKTKAILVDEVSSVQ
jgi:hypothetical protein